MERHRKNGRGRVLISLIMKALPLLPALLLLQARLFALEYPGEEWTRVTPAEAGLDETKLLAARDYALTGDGSGCILRGGRLVLSWGDFKQRYDLKSTTKSFGAAALGLAIADGKMNLTDKARRHHPAFGVPPEENARTGWLDEITLWHLASQTAGFDKKGDYAPLLFKPGSEWAYSDAGPNWLAECVTLAYRRDVAEVLFERLFTPLGIEPADLVWRKNSYRPDLIEGIKRREFGSGISANVDAMARFGLLWLREGEWNGQTILPREFVKEARATQPGVPGLNVRHPEHYGRAANHYGLLWWNNSDETIEGLPLDTYWTWGLHDSLIVVMPTLDIVVARAGKSWRRTEGADPYEVVKPFLLPVVEAVKESGDIPVAKPDENTGRLGSRPSSPVIAGVEWAPQDTIIRLAKGSDNWPLTWASNDALYTAYGDGKGFEPFVEKKLSLGLARITGSPPDFKAENLRAPDIEAEGGGGAGRKASGLLSVDGVLYLLARNLRNSQLAWSSDLGKSWTWADWKFTESFGCPTFLNFGRDYAGARDGFVYVYSQDANRAYDRADRFVMARVPKEKIRDRAAYEFFVKLNAEGQPEWSRDITERGAVFTNPGACYRSGISYNAGLKRYLWCQTGLGDDTRFKGGMTILDAPEPWGPWTVAFHTDDWDTGPGETMSFPPKWISADGLTVHLVFSGDDCFSVRAARLRLIEQ